MSNNEAPDYRDATEECPCCHGSGFVTPGEASTIVQMMEHIAELEAENTELKREPYIQKQQAERIAELEATVARQQMEAMAALENVEAERDALVSYVEHLAHLVEQGEEAQITAFVIEQNVVPFPPPQ